MESNESNAPNLKGGEGNTVESIYYGHLNQLMKSESKRIDDHEDRLRAIESEKLETERRFDTLSRLLEKHELAFDEIRRDSVDLENTVLKEFRESRQQERESRQFLEQLIQRERDSETAAAERSEETKRTRLQTFKDIMIGLFGLIGTIVGGIIAYQEFIVGMFK